MIYYEWSYETVDEHGDIVDSHFSDCLSGFNSSQTTDTLCLVRNEGDEIGGLGDRYWAYVKDGKLPDFFADAMGNFIGIKVPVKFHQKLKTYLAACSVLMGTTNQGIVDGQL